MSDLIVVGFDTPDEADKVLVKLSGLKKEYLIDLEDAVVVVRDEAGKVHLKQSLNLTAIGASSGLLSGALWGGLVGLLFLNPLAGFAIGGAVGAGAGALSGSLTDYGIDDKFIKSLGDTIPNNSSALFVLVRKGSLPRMETLMRRWGSDRVVPVTGDLSKSRLGVPRKWVTEHKDEIDHFFHLAAIYDMTADDATNETLNVGGTRNALGLAVLLPATRRRELVRRDPAPAQPDRDDHAGVCATSRARGGAPGDRQLHALPARTPRRAADPRDRP